jgi:hypothetical protein
MFQRYALSILFFAPFAALDAGKFYDDDPLAVEPLPVNVENAAPRKLSDFYDFFLNQFGHPGEPQLPGKPIPAQAVNTLGEPMDGAWYVKRHYYRPMTIEELQRGPGTANAPSMAAPWQVAGAKAEGITPGFTVIDAAKRQYFLKFDPLSNPEMATAADVITSRIFHALGYHVPENYLVNFHRDQLELREAVQFTDSHGKKRTMTPRDLAEVLMKAPRDKQGRYRAVASLALPGKPIGPFRYFGRRADDPNDTVPHEHRRDLRGFSVFCAWVNHDDSRAINSLDTLQQENGVKFVKHYLIDFGSSLGSASNGPNSMRAGAEYLFAWKPAITRALSFGLMAPAWMSATYPNYPSVGNFEADKFDPRTWVPEYPNSAFLNRLPDDIFWAAKQVMAFTVEQIRAIVKTGQYSDPEAEKYVADTLIVRRDKIIKAFLNAVLPIDRFAVRDGRLQFVDLATAAGELSVRWSRFNNESLSRTALPGNTFVIPREILDDSPGGYYAAEINRGSDAAKSITVYLRKRTGGLEVAGVDRRW